MQFTFDFSYHKIQSLMRCHIPLCVISTNKSPAFIRNVARFCASPRVANQIRDILVHSFSCKPSLLTEVGTLEQASVQASKVSFEKPSVPCYETESVVIWVSRI